MYELFLLVLCYTLSIYLIVEIKDMIDQILGIKLLRVMNASLNPGDCQQIFLLIEVLGSLVYDFPLIELLLLLLCLKLARLCLWINNALNLQQIRI